MVVTLSLQYGHISSGSLPVCMWGLLVTAGWVVLAPHVVFTDITVEVVLLGNDEFLSFY